MHCSNSCIINLSFESFSNTYFVLCGKADFHSWREAVTIKKFNKNHMLMIILQTSEYICMHNHCNNTVIMERSRISQVNVRAYIKFAAGFIAAPGTIFLFLSVMTISSLYIHFSQTYYEWLRRILSQLTTILWFL